MTDKRATVIGSRETPDEVYKLTVSFVNILVELGYAIYSGGCPLGMDHAALKGAYRHKTSDKSRNRIYISWQGMAGLYHDPANGIYNAQLFDNYEQAGEMALATRGSFERLGKHGICHVTRNMYQPLGDDLNTPTDFVLCWAPPSGKKGYVKGGTATAVKVAIQRNIPVFNLYYSDVCSRVEAFVANVLLYKRKLREEQEKKDANAT